MTADTRVRPPASEPIPERRRPWAESITGYEHALAELRRSETGLRAVIACEGSLLRQRDESIQLLEVLGKESDHRFLNSLQMIASLLSMQARAATNPETASQLGIAADRVIMIAAVHHRLHCLDGTRTVAFRSYLEDLCREISSMLGSDDHSGPSISVDATEADLPSDMGTSLGFIVSELITNAA
jgi:two-component sensor histidine kinase